MRFLLAVVKLFSLPLSFSEANGEEQDPILPRAWRCTDKRRTRPHPSLQRYNGKRQQLDAKAREEE